MNRTVQNEKFDNFDTFFDSVIDTSEFVDDVFVDADNSISESAKNEEAEPHEDALDRHLDKKMLSEEEDVADEFCPVCGSTDFVKINYKDKYSYYRCNNCEIYFRHPVLADTDAQFQITDQCFATEEEIINDFHENFNVRCDEEYPDLSAIDPDVEHYYVLSFKDDAGDEWVYSYFLDEGEANACADQMKWKYEAPNGNMYDLYLSEEDASEQELIDRMFTSDDYDDQPYDSIDDADVLDDDIGFDPFLGQYTDDV